LAERQLQAIEINAAPFGLGLWEEREKVGNPFRDNISTAGVNQLSHARQQ
jgi:hypothetical protein